MGNQQNKRIREHKETIKTKAIENAKAQVRRRNEGNSDSDDLSGFSNSIMHETQIEQLDRSGKAFTKADLMALCVHLKGGNVNNPADMFQFYPMTTSDMRAFIRVVLYSGAAKTAGKQNESTLVLPDSNGSKITYT